MFSWTFALKLLRLPVGPQTIFAHETSLIDVVVKVKNGGSQAVYLLCEGDDAAMTENSSRVRGPRLHLGANIKMYDDLIETTEFFLMFYSWQ